LRGLTSLVEMLFSNFSFETFLLVWPVILVLMHKTFENHGFSKMLVEGV
jgi:hypothetical protein